MDINSALREEIMQFIGEPTTPMILSQIQYVVDRFLHKHCILEEFIVTADPYDHTRLLLTKKEKPMRVRNDIVIDIETMGTDDNARIVSIGALIFNPRGDVEKDDLPRLEIFLDHDGQIDRHVDPGTMVWWEKTAGEEARKRAFSTEVPRVPLKDALGQLRAFYKKHTPNNSWACAPDFDMGILEDAYRSIGEKFPTQFWRYRDIRTIEDFVFGGNQRKPGGLAHIGGVAHDALDDCIMEAKVVQLANKRLHG